MSLFSCLLPSLSSSHPLLCSFSTHSSTLVFPSTFPSASFSVDRPDFASLSLFVSRGERNFRNWKPVEMTLWPVSPATLLTVSHRPNLLTSETTHFPRTSLASTSTPCPLSISLFVFQGHLPPNLPSLVKKTSPMQLSAHRQTSLST